MLFSIIIEFFYIEILYTILYTKCKLGKFVFLLCFCFVFFMSRFGVGKRHTGGKYNLFSFDMVKCADDDYSFSRWFWLFSIWYLKGLLILRHMHMTSMCVLDIFLSIENLPTHFECENIECEVWLNLILVQCAYLKIGFLNDLENE